MTNVEVPRVRNRKAVDLPQPPPILPTTSTLFERHDIARRGKRKEPTAHRTYDNVLAKIFSINSFDLYMDEVRRHELLSKEEEKDRFVRLDAARKREDGDEIDILKAEIVARNLRLVVKFAYKYKGNGLDLEDLVQEGNIGLLKAVDKFKVKKGFKFSTYASWWIRQGITRSIFNTANTIRIPTHQGEFIREVKRAEEFLTKLNKGEEPDDQELAMFLEVSLADIRKSRRAELLSSTASLNFKPDADSNWELGDLVTDPNQTSTEETIIARSQRVELMKALDQLPTSQRNMIINKFELQGDEAKTFAELGAERGTSGESVRRALNRAIKDIREILSPPIPEEVAEFIEASTAMEFVDVGLTQRQIDALCLHKEFPHLSDYAIASRLHISMSTLKRDRELARSQIASYMDNSS